MSETFQQYVEKNKLKFKDKKTEKQREADSRHLANMADSYMFSMDGKTAFDQEVVARAAKFIVKTRPYGLTARKINVSDSPIYYKKVKGKMVARGWMERKKLEDAGEQLLKLAKKKDAEYADLDMGEDIEIQTDEWKRQETDPDAPPLNTDVLMDKLTGNGIVDAADNIVLEEEKLLDQNEGLIQKRTREILDRPLKPFDVYKESVSRQMYRALDKELKTLKIQKKPENEITAKRNEIHMKYKETLDRVRKLYTDVEKGLVSPDALKLFLEPDVMTIFSDRLYAGVYHGMEGTTSDVSSAYQTPDYQDEVEKLVDLYEPDQILDQRSNGNVPYTNISRWENLKKGIDDGTPEELKEEEKKAKDAIRREMKKAEKFTHFRGRNYRPGAEGIKRFYITCKRDKFAEMARGWVSALQKNQDIKEDVMFKLGGCVNTSALDNIVLYVPPEADMNKVLAFLDDFSAECGDDVLAEEKEGMQSTKFLKPGITQAVNFPMKQIYGAVISEYDRNAFEKMRKIFQPSKGVPEINPSYNQHLAKIIHLSISMVRKAHPELGGNKKISANKELMKEVKQYVSDFIRLSGIDPVTYNDF